MGNQQTVYTHLQQPIGFQQGVGYTGQTQIGVPLTTFPINFGGVVPINQNNDCCGPNVPSSLQNFNCCTPNYGPGIANTPFYTQNNNQCCDFNGSYSTVPGAVGFGQVGNYQQNQSIDQWCCGPQNYPAVPFVNQQQIVTQQVITQVVPNTASGSLPLVSTLSPIGTTTVFPDPVLNSVIETQVYQPVNTVVEINPFNNLPNRIVTVIQQLGSVNPLRGSIMGRLDAPQYVAEKQAYYEGQWIDGYMQGFGRLFFDSGAYFQGEFVNGLAQTKHGLFIYPDGSYYIGGVDRNVANGVGQFNYRGGRLIYKGQFLNDQPDGHGVQLYSDGSRYEGQFRFGKKEGRGNFVWRDGTVYTGQFENGFMQGEGIHRLSNGEVYEGQFRKNKRHGRGKHVSPLGVYIGGYKRDKKQGEGQFTWSDGKVFKGTFHDGKPDGPGSITVVDGTAVYGIWINGSLDQTSLTTTNPFRGSQINPSGIRGSIASVGSIGSIQNVQFGSALARTSQIVNGPPTINLNQGILNGGFRGTASPFVNQRGSIVSVIGSGGEFRGSSIPRGSSAMIANTPINPIIRGSSISILPRNGPPLLTNVLGRRDTGYPMPPIPGRTSTITTNVTNITPPIVPPVIPSIISPTIVPSIPQRFPSTVSAISPISGVRPTTPIPNNAVLTTSPSIPIIPPPIIQPNNNIGLNPGLNPFNQVNGFNTTRVSSLSPAVARTSQFAIGTPRGVIPPGNQRPIIR